MSPFCHINNLFLGYPFCYGRNRPTRKMDSICEHKSAGGCANTRESSMVYYSNDLAQCSDLSDDVWLGTNVFATEKGLGGSAD